jgi:hypothetical protein
MANTLTTEIIINKQHLDLFGDAGVVLNSSIKNIKELVGNTSDFTKEFTVPATTNNNSILKFYGEFDHQGGFNPHKKIDATLIIKNGKHVIGNIELRGTTHKNGEVESYILVFYGSLISIKNRLSEKKLTDLDWTSYEFVYNYANVIDTWNTPGNILIPVISHELDYLHMPFEKPIDGEYRPENIAAWESSRDVWAPNNGGGVLYTHTKPSYLIKPFVENIFDNFYFDEDNNIKYSVTWDAAISDYLDKMYILPSVEAGGLKPKLTIDSSALFHAKTNNFNYNFPLDGWKRVELDSEIYDYSNSFNTGAWQYECKATGKHTFTIKFRWNTGGFGRLKLDLKLDRGGTITTPGHWQTDYMPNVFNDSETFFTYHDVNMVEGDKLWVEMNMLSNTEVKEVNFILTDSPYATSPATTGFTVSAADMMPDLTAYDFITNFLKTYNLYMVPDGSGNIKIIDNIQYYAQGAAKGVKDWTTFVDISKVNSRKLELAKSVKLTYADGKDRNNVAYEEAIGKPYGEITHYPDIDFGTEKLEIKSIFTIIPPYTMDSITNEGLFLEDTNIPLHPQMSGDSKPINADFLLFYYNGMQPSHGWWMQEDSGPDGIPIFKAFDKFPYVTSVKDYIPVNVSDSLTYDYTTGMDTTTVPEGTNYAHFFAPYLQRMYDKNTRQVTIDGVLPLNEYLNFELDNRILIDGIYYIVIELKYNLITNTVNMVLESFNTEFTEFKLTDFQGDGKVSLLKKTGKLIPFGPASASDVSDNFKKTHNLKTRFSPVWSGTYLFKNSAVIYPTRTINIGGGGTGFSGYSGVSGYSGFATGISGVSGFSGVSGYSGLDSTVLHGHGTIGMQGNLSWSIPILRTDVWQKVDMSAFRQSTFVNFSYDITGDFLKLDFPVPDKTLVHVTMTIYMAVNPNESRLRTFYVTHGEISGAGGAIGNPHVHHEWQYATCAVQNSYSGLMIPISYTWSGDITNGNGIEIYIKSNQVSPPNILGRGMVLTVHGTVTKSG